jgi:hypothetical protein
VPSCNYDNKSNFISIYKLFFFSLDRNFEQY